MTSVNIAFHNSIDVASLSIEHDANNVFDSTTLTSNGTAIFDVARSNFSATNSDGIVYNPFVFYTDQTDNLNSTTDELLFGVNFKSGSSINTNLSNAATLAIMTQFDTTVGSTTVTLSGTTLEKTPARAYVINNGNTFFGTPKGADLFDLPSDYYTGIDTLTKASFEYVLADLDGVWVNSSGTVIADLKDTPTHSVGDTIPNHPTLIINTYYLTQKPELFADISTSAFLSALQNSDSTLHSTEYPSNHHFNTPFHLPGSANSSTHDQATDMTFRYLQTLSGANQANLTNRSPAPTTEEKTLIAEIQLRVVDDP